MFFTVVVNFFISFINLFELGNVLHFSTVLQKLLKVYAIYLLINQLVLFHMTMLFEDVYKANYNCVARKKLHQSLISLLFTICPSCVLIKTLSSLSLSHSWDDNDPIITFYCTVKHSFIHKMFFSRKVWWVLNSH